MRWRPVSVHVFHVKHRMLHCWSDCGGQAPLTLVQLLPLRPPYFSQRHQSSEWATSRLSSDVDLRSRTPPSRSNLSALSARAADMDVSRETFMSGRPLRVMLVILTRRCIGQILGREAMGRTYAAQHEHPSPSHGRVSDHAADQRAWVATHPAPCTSELHDRIRTASDTASAQGTAGSVATTTIPRSDSQRSPMFHVKHQHLHRVSERWPEPRVSSRGSHLHPGLQPARP